MSQENMEIVRRVDAALKRGDREGALADFHPDAEWRDLRHPPDMPECVRGASAIRALWDQWDQAFPGYTADFEEIIEPGDFVVVLTHWRVQGSGLALDVRTRDVFEFADKSIIRVTT